MAASRRDFLKAAIGTPAALSLGATLPAFLERAAAAASPGGGRVLVVVQLAGGNDGLNTVVPYDHDEYGRNRDTLRLTARDVLPIEPGLGFHPVLTAWKGLFDEGLLGIVQGVGYANPQGGHEESMRIWQTARLEARTCQTGWLGRAIDQAAEAASVPGMFVGQIPRPLTVNAAGTVVPTVGSIEECLAGGLDLAQTTYEAIHRAAAAEGPEQPPLLAEVRRRSRSAWASVERIEKVVRAGTHASYPSTDLADMLRIVAELIDADLGIRIFNTELGGVSPGGFDNHAAQRDNHAALLKQLSESVSAFVADLKGRGLLDRVVLVTFSEFGRTLAENGRRGTDHGSAAPVFLAGGAIVPGLIGSHPSLAELENWGPKHHTDFRRLYATLLDRWLEIDSQAVLGERFDSLEILRA